MYMYIRNQGATIDFLYRRYKAKFTHSVVA